MEIKRKGNNATWAFISAINKAKWNSFYLKKKKDSLWLSQKVSLKTQQKMGGLASLMTNTRARPVMRDAMIML